MPLALMTLIYTIYLIDRYRPSLVIVGLLIFGLFFPFLLNGVLFDPSYMSDQFRYVRCASELRSQLSCLDSPSVQFASAMFALSPAPFVESILSISLINRLFFLMMIHFLFQLGFLWRPVILFFLLVPSIQIYSAVALRDNLIFLSFFMCLFCLFSRRYFLLFIFLPILFFLRPYFVVGVVTVPVMLLVVRSGKFSNIGVTLCLFFFCLILSDIFLSDLILPIFNDIKLAFFYENGGLGEFVRLTSVSESVADGISRFLFSFTLLTEGGGLQYIVALESIILLCYFGVLVWSAPNNARWLQLIFPSIFLGAMIAVFVYNDGTLSRYLYPIKASICAILLACNLVSVKTGANQRDKFVL